MKRIPSLLALFALLSGTASAAPIPIPAAGLVYTQNFNTLANATNNGTSTTPWVDDSTLPGWRLYRAGSGTPTGFVGNAYTYRVADGSSATPQGGEFYSLGPATSIDRALGNPASTTPGELSAIVVFQNSSGLTVELTNISHNVEVVRNNQYANFLETLFVWSRTSATQAGILAMTTAPVTTALFPASVATSPTTNSHYVTGWDRRTEAERSYTGGAASAQVNVSLPVNVAPSTPILIPPGHFFAIRYANIKDGGTDHLMGIDDVRLTFTPLAISLSAAVSGVVRQNNGTPSIPEDDTVDFSLNVTGVGGVSANGWKVSAPGNLAGITGSYGIPKGFTGIPLADFTGLQHTFQITVEDAADSSATASATVTAPWCSLTPVVSSVLRNDGGTLTPFDDTWSFTVTVNGLFTSSSWTSNSSALPSGDYATPYTLSDLPAASPVETIIFRDSADTTCTATVTIILPRIIGSMDFGFPQVLLSDAAGVPAPWSADETAPAQTLANGGTAASTYRSEVLDLTGIGDVKFTGSLFVRDTSSGNETADTFNAQLIINGNTAAPVSLITASDIITPANNLLTGAELSPAAAGPPPVSGPGEFTHQFFYLIPASANSVQLVISGNNDSTSESFTVRNLRFVTAAHSLEALPAAGGSFTNKGTVDPADDEITRRVTVVGVLPPPGSTGWFSDSNPAAGLYTAPNPITFGPFPMSGPPIAVTLTDNNVPTINTGFTIPYPVPRLTAVYVTNSGLIFVNGIGSADDTATLNAQVAAAIGGPEFRISASYPCQATTTNPALSGTVSTTTINLTNIPEHGPLTFTFTDASYPASTAEFTLFFGTIADPAYLMGSYDLGGGVTELLSLPAPSDQWQNFPASPLVRMSGSAAGTGVALASQVVSLSGVSGAVQFSGTLRIVDTDAGMEAADSFKAELIIDGNTASPVNLTAAYDANSNGVMNGGDPLAADEFNKDKLTDGKYVSIFPLSYTIPDSASSVQLVLTGVCDSATESILVEDITFLAGNSTADTDGDGVSDNDEAIMGTAPNDSASVTRLRQSAASPVEFTFTGVDDRFYRIYRSDDNAVNNHLTQWVDTGMATVGGAGEHTVTVQIEPGVTRRFYRLHVMTTDGPWPTVVP